jgi:hypothetical protein
MKKNERLNSITVSGGRGRVGALEAMCIAKI